MKYILLLLPVFLFTGIAKNSKNSNRYTIVVKTFFDNKNLKVLIIGSLEWKDSANLRSFSKYHRKDVELEETLRSVGVNDSNIISLYDKNSELANIYKALDKIAVSSNADSRFFFYYAGHGFWGKDTNDKSNIYFANYDIQYRHTKSTGFDINYLADGFSNKFKGREFLFMADCCKSGGLINVAKKISRSGAKAAAITSCTSSDISTANWTFTQKLIEALKGDGFINSNGDRVVSFHELAAGVDSAMKYDERQKADAAFFNWNEEEPISSNAQTVLPLSTKRVFNGEYVFACKNNAYWQTQIIGETADAFICRYYNYSDYEQWSINKDSIKIPYFIKFSPGTEVVLQRKTPCAAKILNGNDGFYYTKETETNTQGCYTYEWLLTGKEQKVKILDNNHVWEDGKILEQKLNAYYITYNNKDFTADEWVSADRIKF